MPTPAFLFSIVATIRGQHGTSTVTPIKVNTDRTKNNGAEDQGPTVLGSAGSAGSASSDWILAMG